MPYSYEQGKDGTDNDIYILHPGGGKIAQITFWHDEPDYYDDAIKTAQLIVDALNGHAAMSKLLDSLKEVTRICEAMRFTTGLGKNQLERIERAKAIIAEATVKAAG